MTHKRQSVICSGLILLSFVTGIVLGSFYSKDFQAEGGVTRFVSNYFRVNQILELSKESEVESWSNIEDSKYPVYVYNLKKQEFPNDVIEDILYSEISENYSQQILELLNDYKSDHTLKVYSILKEKISSYLSVLNTFQKRPILNGVIHRYQLLREECEKTFLDLISLDRALEQLESEEYAEISKYLSGKELLNYRLENTRQGAELKIRFQLIEPSVEELVKILELESKLKTTAIENLSSSEFDMEEFSDYKMSLIEEFSNSIGKDRYTEYKMVNMPGHKTIIPLAQKYDLEQRKIIKYLELLDEVNRKVKLNRVVSDEYKDEIMLELETILGSEAKKEWESRYSYTWPRNVFK